MLALAVSLFALSTGAGTLLDSGDSEDVDLTRRWLSDTERQAAGNHHAATGARIDGEGWVFAPISGGVQDHAGSEEVGDDHAHANATAHDRRPNASSCGLYALRGSTGAIEWHRTVPAANCSIHAIADPTVANVTADASPEVLATSTTERLVAYRSTDGSTVLARSLPAHGYTRPVVANLTADPGPEILAADVRGNVTVFGSNASDDSASEAPQETWSPRWSVDLDGFVWAEPQILRSDGRPVITIALGDGRIVALAPDGRILWNRSVLEETDGLTWATAIDAGETAGRSIVAAASGGAVVRVEDDGSVAWRRNLGAYTAVRATREAGENMGRADSTGSVVYATNRAGDLYALDGETGETRWETSLTDADVQMTPPPVIGNVAGGPAPELIAVTNDGGVHVLDPADGTILASGGRSTPILTHASLLDVDGDGLHEIVVTYGDGRIARFDASRGA